MKWGSTLSLVLPALASGASAAAADLPTLSMLLGAGGKIEAVVAFQQYPYFYVSTPAPDTKLYVCAADFGEIYKFFDPRQPARPLTIPTQCSELR